MDVSRNGGEVAFRTAFSPDYDLVQVLCGAAPGDPARNNPVDFKMAGLQRRGHADIWHVDRVLAFSTDECSPFVINGEDIGGNHGHTCAIRAFVPGHGLTCRQAGTLWQDESGMTFTLLRAESPDCLLLMSDNIGPSLYDYDFADHITGCLRCGTAVLRPVRQQGHVQLTPAIRHLKRQVLCLQNGAWQHTGSWHEDVEQAEIREEYEIVNPATVAPALRAQRPADGYAEWPSLAVGEAMLLHRMTYRIQPDGAILCDFDHTLLQPVRWTHYLGIMHQEKCDAFGGGVWRVIPGLRPFVSDGILYDFTRPYNTTQGPMPNWHTLTPDTWADPACPPDRQLDLILRPDGTCAAAFESAFLPVYDGEPCKRAKNITDAGDVVPSRKTYPTFAGGRAGRILIQNLRGVARKRYLPKI